jgi:hypothetical protein
VPRPSSLYSYSRMHGVSQPTPLFAPAQSPPSFTFAICSRSRQRKPLPCKSSLFPLEDEHRRSCPPRSAAALLSRSPLTNPLESRAEARSTNDGGPSFIAGHGPTPSNGSHCVERIMPVTVHMVLHESSSACTNPQLYSTRNHPRHHLKVATAQQALEAVWQKQTGGANYPKHPNDYYMGQYRRTTKTRERLNTRARACFPSNPGPCDARGLGHANYRRLLATCGE